MKWNILVASMVLGLGLSTQSFGFDLLDRMLGGCGCEAKGCAADCCQKDGVQKACDKGCAQKDGKGCCQKAGLGLGLLNGCAQKGDGCCQKADGKGCCQKDGKDCCQKDGKGCCQKACGPSLLDRIFARRCCDAKGGKGDGKCDGKDGKAEVKVEAESDDAPMPPAPVVDASAFIHGQRSVVQASTSVVD